MGKSTLISRLQAWRPDLWLSVSATTRPPRPGEVPDVDYHFCSEEAFDDLVAHDDLLEWAEVFGHRYGTPREPVEQALHDGRDVLFDVDVHGARSIKRKIPGARSSLVAPPSIEDLRERLASRGTDSAEVIERRLARAREWLAAAPEFDFVVVNDDVERAWRRIADIISGTA